MKQARPTRFSLDGVKMAPVATAEQGEVSGETLMTFKQSGEVVTACYRGGSIVEGFLIGFLSGADFRFRYIQADTSGRLDAGKSNALVEVTKEGKLRMIEHFEWATRPASGTNIFEEVC